MFVNAVVYSKVGTISVRSLETIIKLQQYRTSILDQQIEYHVFN